MNEKNPTLTKNEKKVLKEIVEKGRITDTDISKKITISQQAVYQMRKKLEDLGIIEGYVPLVNFNKIGINIFLFVGIKILPDLWKKFSEEEIKEKLCRIPYVFMASRIALSDISYLLVFGFKDIEEEESFKECIETELSGNVEVRWSYKTNTTNMIRCDILNLVYHALNDKEVNVKKMIKDIIE